MVDVFNAGLTAVMKSVWDAAIYTVNKPSPTDDELFLSETMKQRNLLDIDWCLTTFNMSNTSNGLRDGDNTIKDVVCPVVSFWGDKDVIVLEYMIDETVAEVNDIKKIVFENSGHSPLVDVPEKLSQAIIKFCS
jgi:pimeloyl-ACP methyl ester carboxylesterase